MTETHKKLIEYFKQKNKDYIEFDDVQKILLSESYYEIFGIKMNINCENQMTYAYMQLYEFINNKYEF